jgi:hypothetical protein
MRIPIPRFILTAWDAFGVWSNVPIHRFGRFELRRIDILLVFFGVFCAGYYWLVAGWLGALQGLAMYLFVLMIALWIL